MALEKGNENQQNQSNSDLAAVQQLQNMVAKLSEELANLKKNGNTASNNSGGGLTAEDVAKIIRATRDENMIDYESGITADQIPDDDYLEDPVRLCSPFVGYMIVDDIRKGHRVKLPYGKKSIFFKYGATRKYQQGKYEALAPYSEYFCKSKKELEWLKDHSHYGIYFYETTQGAMDADVQKLQKLSRIMGVIQGYEMHDLNKRCREYGVELGDDPRNTRLKLAFKMVERELESEKRSVEKTLEEHYKTHLMLKDSK